MRRTRFDDRPCAVARVTDLIGDWWTPLVLWQLTLGCTRFGELEEALGCSRSVLTQRLQRLVDEGLIVRTPYSAHPPRYDYRLSQKGEEFGTVLAAMWRWGSDWMFDDEQPPCALVANHTGDDIRPLVVDEYTGEPLPSFGIRSLGQR